MKKEERIALLNKAYKLLLTKAKNILKEVTVTFPDAKLSFYNGHYTSIGKVYTLEHFPLPVIDINKDATIVVDFDGANYECYYNKQFIQNLTPTIFNFLTKRSFASYPYEDCLIDLYKKGMTLNDYLSIIKSSESSSFAINFKLGKNYKEDVSFIISQLLQ